MKNMDAASKLFTGLPEVFCDLVDFALRETGFKVVRDSLKERNTETIARGWYKKVSNDVVAELQVTDGNVTATLLVVLENQTSTSAIMAGRSLMATTVRWDAWRREMKHNHLKRKELQTSQEMLDGVLPGDRMTPVMVLVVHFGQEAWTGLPRFTDTLDCPAELKPMLADCVVNIISFYNLPSEEINRMPPGAVRAVTKSIRHVDDIERLCQELKTDPSFRMLLDEGPDEALDIITIATGLDMRALKQEKEKDMEKVVSKIEQHFFNKCIALNKDEWLEKGRVEGIAEGRLEGREEGIAEGIAEGEIKAVLKFIRWQRNRHIPESQILEALLSGFELDEATARQYMDVK